MSGGLFNSREHVEVCESALAALQLSGEDDVPRRKALNSGASSPELKLLWRRSYTSGRWGKGMPSV